MYVKKRNLSKEYLALQNLKKYLFCTWKLLFNEGNYAIRIYGCRQKDKKSDRKTDRQKGKLLYKL